MAEPRLRARSEEMSLLDGGDAPAAGASTARQAEGAAPRRGPLAGRARAHRRRWLDAALLAVGGLAVAVVMRVVAASARKRFIGDEELERRFAAREPVILTFWHGRMVMMPFAYRGRGACIMNSRHRDGELISRAIRRFGIEVVHGSSTRGWVGGLKGLLAANARGRDLVVVPDGPRGPRCRAKSGVIQLARATGAAIFPASHGASRAWVLRRSWDWLSIPGLFARVAYVVAEPMVVPQDAAAEEIEELTLELERRLNDATRRADAEVGVAPEETRSYIDGVAMRGES
jgi:lysophospholipid acyltransferase (LPLAT)-like uncharacterized protein